MQQRSTDNKQTISLVGNAADKSLSKIHYWKQLKRSNNFLVIFENLLSLKKFVSKSILKLQFGILRYLGEHFFVATDFIIILKNEYVVQITNYRPEN